MKHFAAKQDLDVSNLTNASLRNRLGCYLPTSLEQRLGQPRIHRE
jgi:hypothetical protein